MCASFQVYVMCVGVYRGQRNVLDNTNLELHGDVSHLGVLKILGVLLPFLCSAISSSPYNSHVKDDKFKAREIRNFPSTRIGIWKIQDSRIA